MRSAKELGASKRPAAFLVKHPTTRTNHIFMREEQAQVVADEWDVDYHGLYLKRISEIAADYIERTAAAADGPITSAELIARTGGTAKPIFDQGGFPPEEREASPFLAPPAGVGTIGHIDHGKTSLLAAMTKVIAAEQSAPSDRLPEFETTAGQREAWAVNSLAASEGSWGSVARRLLRDLDKAIAFAASETKRADELRAALKIATDDKLNFLDQISALTAERDREAAARRDAEARLVAMEADRIPEPVPGEMDGHDDPRVSAGVVLKAYGWQVDKDGRLYGLVAGDMGYAATHIVLSPEDRWENPTILARAEQAEAREATLRAALRDADEIITAVVDPGLVPRSLEEIYEAYEARAALATTRTGEGS